MRRETTAMHSIHNMCASLNLEQDAILHKSKLLLKVYRDVVWASLRDADTLYKEASDFYGGELSAALAYLSDFAPSEKKREFEERVSGLFETKWMIGLISAAMERVKEYHAKGGLYHEILSKCYLTAQAYSETDILSMLNIERSVFYERKREAVSLFGIAMWGFTIPKLRGILKDGNNGNKNIPIFFLETSDLAEKSRLFPDKRTDKTRTDFQLSRCYD